jgi:hypothetical protein
MSLQTEQNVPKETVGAMLDAPLVVEDHTRLPAELEPEMNTLTGGSERARQEMPELIGLHPVL